MIVSWARLTTRPKTGTISVPTEVAVGGHEEVLNGVREVHKTSLKGTTDTIENLDIRFAAQDVAVGTLTSTMSPFTSPDGVKYGAERHIRTFVVVKRGGRWLIMQDHNTTAIEFTPAIRRSSPAFYINCSERLHSQPAAATFTCPKSASRK